MEEALIISKISSTGNVWLLVTPKYRYSRAWERGRSLEKGAAAGMVPQEMAPLSRSKPLVAQRPESRARIAGARGGEEMGFL